MKTQNSLTKRNHIDTNLYPNGFVDAIPENLSLSDIVSVLPKEVFQKNMIWAWGQVTLTTICAVLSLYWTAVSPWYLLPLVWVFAGTNMMGMFCIGHDCGHLSFSTSHTMNDLVGIIFMSPLLYPFESWRIQHNHHHNHTSKLHIDNTWQPLQAEFFHNSSPGYQLVLKGFRTSLWWLASVFAHQFQKHYFFDQFTKEQLPKVKVSILSCLAFACVLPVLWYFTGVWGVVKFWFIPWIVFHFWLDTITLIHHTLPHLPFLPEGKWTQPQARLGLTVHCEYPAWVEWLTHHINVHIPHHVTTAIPSYNLRTAHTILKKNYGKYMNEVSFSWDLIRDITTSCHVYDEDYGYVSFEQSTSQFEKQQMKHKDS